MAVQKFAYCFPLSLPSTFIPLTKDLFVIRSPYRTTIGRTSQEILEPPNATPQNDPLHLWFVPQDPFDGRVRTLAASYGAFAQYLVHLFRGEKPERTAARRIAAMICHRTKHRVEFDRSTSLPR